MFYPSHKWKIIGGNNEVVDPCYFCDSMLEPSTKNKLKMTLIGKTGKTFGKVSHVQGCLLSRYTNNSFHKGCHREATKPTNQPTKPTKPTKPTSLDEGLQTISKAVAHSPPLSSSDPGSRAPCGGTHRKQLSHCVA